MAVIQGKMFLLVHVDRHRDQMGEICNRLVTDYGVPVSICDDIQKVCPKCLASPDAKSDSSPVSTTTVTQSSDHHHPEESKSVTKIIPQIAPKLFPQTAPKLIPVTSAPQKTQPIQLKTVMSPITKTAPVLTKVLPLPPKNMPITLRVAPSTTAPRLAPTPSKPSNGNHLPTPSSTQMMVVKKRESPVPQVVPEVKKIKIEEPPAIKEEEFVFEDLEDEDDNDILGNVLKALQNGGSELAFNGSPSSDDAASNSSNTYDVDDEDYQGSWNPDLLTNFITSQPAIFGATTQESSRTPSKTPTVGANGKRLVPPMLTVNGKTRRGRIVYTARELDILEKYYEQDPNACADPKKRDAMCKTLSIDYHRLKVWFQNRRRKDKVKSQEDPLSITNGMECGLEV